FMQCAPYLERLNVEQISVENTAIAAEMVAKNGNPQEGAIASKRAAEKYGLNVLAETINFEKTNETRFVILSKKRQYTSTAGKISISIFPGEDESGVLYNILSHFLYIGLNMCHIESVPLQKLQM
ncbi:MAG: bifunctional chorismate mutase/prephenate dehydratase, partial [Clostridiales bacterium]|nr:bifunctional chorismate mutase/prephenate dehydratase [Clostridiales bacterium]